MEDLWLRTREEVDITDQAYQEAKDAYKTYQTEMQNAIKETQDETDILKEKTDEVTDAVENTEDAVELLGETVDKVYNDTKDKYAEMVEYSRQIASYTTTMRVEMEDYAEAIEDARLELQKLNDEKNKESDDDDDDGNSPRSGGGPNPADGPYTQGTSAKGGLTQNTG